MATGTQLALQFNHFPTFTSRSFPTDQARFRTKTVTNGVKEIRVMYDLMVAVMRVDAARVITYRMPAYQTVQRSSPVVARESGKDNTLSWKIPERRCVIFG